MDKKPGERAYYCNISARSPKTRSLNETRSSKTHVTHPDQVILMIGRSTVSIVFLTAAVGHGTRTAPFGAARVASAVKAVYGTTDLVNVHFVEGYADESAEFFATKFPAENLLNCHHLIIGLSLYSWNSSLLISAGALIKAKYPHALLVAGGPDASADPDRLYARGAADIIVACEGEAVMLDIVSSMLNDKPLPGPVIHAPLLDPALLTSPWLDGTLDSSRWGSAALELTRGCPYRCSFCFESKGSARLRKFPLDTVRKELICFSKAGVEEVFVLDPTFNADERRMEEAIHVFREAGPGLRYMVELRAELLSAKQAKLLSSINCSVQIGLQSSESKVLVNVNRTMVPDIFAKKVSLLDKAGVVYGLDLIYGLPGDTLAGFKRSLDFALSLGPNHLDVFRLAVLPGTELADKAEYFGLEYDTNAPYLVRATPHFSAEDLNAAEKLANAADIFYTKGRAVMWFRALMKLLGTRPSLFLSRFSNWLQTQPDVGQAPAATKTKDQAVNKSGHSGLEKLQLSFLSTWFSDSSLKGGSAVQQAALDLVRVSGAWTRALAEGERTTLELHWQPLDLLDFAAADIKGFASRCASSRGTWICEPGGNGPHFKKSKNK